MQEPGSFAGAQLQQYRATAGLSQEELAERAGLSRRGISEPKDRKDLQVRQDHKV